MADPAPSRRGPVALPAGGSPRSLSGAARRRPAAGRDRPADVCRARGAVARRRLCARRPHQARGGARAGGLFRYVRAAARLYPSAALSAVRRAGAGHRRDAGGDRPRHRAARARAGLVAAGRALGAARGSGVWAAGAVLAREPALGGAAKLLRRLDPSGEPFADAARLGPFAMLLVYGIIARAERAARRRRHAPPDAAAGPATTAAACGRSALRRSGGRAPRPTCRWSWCSASCSSTRAGRRRDPRRPAAGLRRLCGAGRHLRPARCRRRGAPTRCAPSSRC